MEELYEAHYYQTIYNTAPDGALFSLFSFFYQYIASNEA
jgi:hypothetical protein